ncbi:MAG: ECF transporter S component, partial [Candidatus Bathyarchaeia archaeon]
MNEERVTLSRKGSPMSLQLVMTAMNAAVYAGIGALWTAFPLLIFGVRFWPQVFVPATFSVLFGPWVGGVGAAIGIFLADVIYGHHDALLSF